MEVMQPSDRDLEAVSDVFEFESNCSGPSSVKNKSATTMLKASLGLAQHLILPSESPRKESSL